MNRKQSKSIRAIMLVTLLTIIVSSSLRLRADTDTCDGQTITIPFSDVGGSVFFCSIAEAYFTGLTNGTTPTTYSPNDPVPRGQMAAFITRTQDSALKRGSRRAALNQWAIPPGLPSGAVTDVGSSPTLVQCDGADLWVANNASGEVSRVRASDGKLLDTWTGAPGAWGVLVARGRIFVTGFRNPGAIYRIEPSLASGNVAVLANNLGAFPEGITTDGRDLWTANFGGSVSKVAPGTGDVQNFTAGFTHPTGILFDGDAIWITDAGDNKLKKLNSNGTIAQSVTVGAQPQFPIFDGLNIWVPCQDNKVMVVRASTGVVLATLTGNSLNNPSTAAFDGEFVMVSNYDGDSVSMWRATDFNPIDSYSTGSGSTPLGVCSDGARFWVTLSGMGKLGHF